MDVPVPVEATIHLNQFQDKTEVLQILQSHGFQLSDLGEGQVHIQGYFSNLKAVKVRLERLIETQTNTTLRSPSPSSGAISKYYNKDNRGRSRSRDKPPSSPFSSSAGASKLNPPTSQDSTTASSSPDQQASIRTRHETVVVDADVFRYAEQIRRRDIDSIKDSYQVRMQVQENSSSYTITLQGRKSNSAAGELQKLLDDLSRSLRTQEVPLRDMDQDGIALLKEIQRNKHIFGLVVVLEMEDRLHLIGPSVESYNLKQRLLGRQIKSSERPGRPFDRNLRNRSSSLPPNSRKNTERESRSNPPPRGAAGFSSSMNQEDKPEAADVHHQNAASRGRTNSETRGRKEPERANYFEPQRESGFNPPHGGAANFSSPRNQEDKPEAAALNTRSRTSRTRSQSKPHRPKDPDRETDFNPHPGGAAGFSSSKNQQDKPEAADVPQKGGASRTRSQSEPRRPKEPERSNDIVRNKLLPSKSLRSIFQRLFIWKFLKPKSKKNNER
ncbi:uncharacterized protein LOC110968203 [Acanthochromis polyacanthus]|uniref:uncharacterized protein LOC110968203 n=1 Tax=Acanthochromis polyacanthus TaxID=80966 RepID=UPI000B8F7173|nr:uncharacterized protein LOC110968203 [Acanthochromis polyacanthus]